MRLDERLRAHITNTLSPVTTRVVAGIVGDEPSKYAKTPVLWNAAFRDLGWDAVSLPYDVAPGNLAAFVGAIRDAREVAGFSVTVPYKIDILPLLDDLDPIARQIGAVNMVGRTESGALVGYNTDGQGAIDALTRKLPGMDRPFLPDGLKGRHVLLLGAGGAARGVAFYVASAMLGTGTLRIVNRTAAKAVALATGVRAAYGIGEGAGEDKLHRWIGDADLVINATVVGQSGWRRAPAGAFLVEPYSPLAPSNPALVGTDRPMDGSIVREWFLASKKDVQTNAYDALDATSRLNPAASCFDLVYSPLETRFLRDARLAGHPTLNGKWMNVAQAADGFARRVLAKELAAGGLAADAAYDRVFEAMARVW